MSVLRLLWLLLGLLIAGTAMASPLDYGARVVALSVTRQAFAEPDADEKLLKSKDYRPRLTVLELHRKGYQSAPDLDPERKAALVGLEEKSGESYWLTFQNFFVITRYNRSPLYAMAVYQLGEELRQRVEASP